MTTYLLSNTVIAGGWISKVFCDTSSSLVGLSDQRPDVFVVDLSCCDRSCLRAIRRVFDGPLVVIGSGKLAAEAIQQGADDYSRTLEEAPRIIEQATGRQKTRELAVSLNKHLALAVA